MLAALHENAERHRALLNRIADDPYNREGKDEIRARASAVFGLLETITAAERQCAANAELSDSRHNDYQITNDVRAS